MTGSTGRDTAHALRRAQHIAPINSIVPFSTVDGPGNRTAIFFQGCNLACRYCHNPETQALCRHCGRCVERCPTGALSWNGDLKGGGRVEWDESRCTACDTCLSVCPYFASPRAMWLSVEQVMERVRKQVPFIRGITASGGECTLYPAFLTELFAVARGEGLSTFIDSNGATDFRALPELLTVADGVMLDVKAWDPTVYRTLTACTGETREQEIGRKENRDVRPVSPFGDRGSPAAARWADADARRRNIRFLADHGKLAELRIVCLDGHVDAEAVIDGCADVLGGHATATPLKLIAFRPNGVRGDLAHTPAPTDTRMEALRMCAKGAGFNEIVVT